MEIVRSHLNLEKGEEIVPFKAALEHITRLCRVMVSKSAYCATTRNTHTHTCACMVVQCKYGY